LNPFEQLGAWICVGRGSIERRGPLDGLETPDSLQDLRKVARGFRLPEKQFLAADSSDGLGPRESPDALTGVAGIDETTMATSEFDDRPACARQALPKCRCRNLQDACGVRPVELQNLAEDVRETMRAVETREQRVHTSDFHFFEQERLVCWPLVPLGGEIAESTREILGESFEGQALSLDAAPRPGAVS
jgi:hypothetical protein